MNESKNNNRFAFPVSNKKNKNAYGETVKFTYIKPVLGIRIRSDSHHFAGSGSAFTDIFANLYLKAGLWIPINFLRIRIRIQSLMLEANTDPDLNPDPDPDPIRIQGLNDQKLKKNYN
jgi:hypothetical protein